MKSSFNDKLNDKTIQVVKQKVIENTPISEFYQQTNINDEQATQIFHILRRQGFPVFIGENQGHSSYCSYSDYRVQQGYNDVIRTHASSIGIGICADLHLGSIDDCIAYVYGFINYCVKNGITDIIINGDLIEGIEYFKCHNDSGLLRIKPDIYEQLKYVNDALPCVPGITYHFIFGNHDKYSINGIAYDIVKDLRECFGRNDIKVFGCEYGKIQINRDHFRFIHNSMTGLNQSRSKHKQSLSFFGGGHKSEFISDYREVVSYKSVPPLSNKKPRNTKNDDNNVMVFPGFIDFRIEFESDRTAQNLYINDIAFTNPSNPSYCQCVNTNRILNYRVRK